MKRRSFLAMLGLAPVVAATTGTVSAEKLMVNAIRASDLTVNNAMHVTCRDHGNEAYWDQVRGDALRHIAETKRWIEGA